MLSSDWSACYVYNCANMENDASIQQQMCLKKSDTALTRLDNWKNNNCLLNSLHRERVNICINFSSRIFFLSEPSIHQIHLFLSYKGPPIGDCKPIDNDSWHFLPVNLIAQGSLEFFQHFFSVLFQRCWSDRLDESLMQHHLWTCNPSTPFSQSVLSDTFPNFSIPFHSLIFVSICFHFSVLMVSVELHFTSYWNK